MKKVLMGALSLLLAFSTPMSYVQATNTNDNLSVAFGEEFNLLKEFDRTSMEETVIGETGCKVNTSSSNYNNVVIMNEATKKTAGTGYYPLNSIGEDYYLFLGSGGNGSVNATLTLPTEIEAGTQVAITYAKPCSTNNGSTNRSAGNDNILTYGGVSMDVEEACEFDQWYTTVMEVQEKDATIDLELGKWSSIAISQIEVVDGINLLTIDNDGVDSVYILDEDVSIQYNAKLYDSITYLKATEETVAYGTELENGEVKFGVEEYEGVSMEEDGTLTISKDAKEGIVTVYAEYGNMQSSTTLELKAVDMPDGLNIVGPEIGKPGESLTYHAIPTISGNALKEQSTSWSILGESRGCTIEDGILTIPQNAPAGLIVIKAVLDETVSMGDGAISTTYTITIQGETQMLGEVIGVLLEGGKTQVKDANSVAGVAFRASGLTDEQSLVVKAEDKNGFVIAEKTVELKDLSNGVQKVDVDLEIEDASVIKAYLINAKEEIVSDTIFSTETGIYSNIPLVADWITGEKSGLGMGAGIIAPTNVPAGVDPELVDTSTLNVEYTYDDNYVLPEKDNILWYKQGAYLASAEGANNSIYARDAADWEQKALPIGNGYMGAMLFGLPDKDQIQVNEETFWAAGYRGTQTEVEPDTVNRQMSEGINGYMSVGNVFVDFHMPENAVINNYYRDLDLEEAISHVSYEYNDILFEREYFASYPREVVAWQYTASEEGALNFDVIPVMMHPGEVIVSGGDITIIGKLKDSEPYNSGGNAAWNQESDLEYCMKLKVIVEDGTVEDGYNCVKVSDASKVTILMTAATDYDKNQFVLTADGNVDMTQTPYKSAEGVAAAISKATNRMESACAISYDELKAEHIADYKNQYDTVEFSLTDENEVCQVPTDELQQSYKDVISTQTTESGSTRVTYSQDSYEQLSHHLEELHFNYARYLMISSSRSTSLPATLQGKWCQSTAEIWGSCYCININMEMNYWFAGGANLLDSGKALIDWFNTQIPAGRITAKNMYQVTPKSYTFENGEIKFADSEAAADDVFIMHTKQAIMGTTDMTGSTSIQSAGNTAWLMYNLWDLYQTSGDKELLENDLYPIMRSCANFYTQYLYTNMRKETTDLEDYPYGYYYTTWTGRSPEQGPTDEGIKYDLQLVAGMYDYVIEAATILGVDSEKVAAWKEIRNHLEMPVEIGDDGQIKEWKQETSYNTDSEGNALGDPQHRHISHLVGLYPGTLINRENEELLEGAKIVLENRGDDSTGWSCSNKFLLWARCLDGDRALEIFRYQLARRTYSNLFDTHSPFQIDGNFGSAAGVMELLMQSHTGETYILPALPTAWEDGKIAGIKAKDGSTVSIEWSEGKAERFTITPVKDGDVTVGYEKENEGFLLNGNAIAFDESGLYTIENAKAGVTYEFVAKEAEENPTPTPVPTTTPAPVTQEKQKGVTYKVSGNGVTINKIDKEATTVTIPATITTSDGRTYKVTGIAKNAAKGNTKLTKVVMGSNITSIGDYAFYGCKNLKSVTIGKNVTKLGKYAFAKCTSLTKITIPDKVKMVGSNAFYGCTKLKTVKLGKSLTAISDKMFYKCSALTKITVPSKVTKIGKSAFYKCTSLKKLTIPASVKTIGANAFNGCKNLKSITIKTTKLTTKNVGNKAFSGINAKATIKVPAKKLADYKTLLVKKGVKKTATIKK